MWVSLFRAFKVERSAPFAHARGVIGPRAWRTYDILRAAIHITCQCGYTRFARSATIIQGFSGWLTKISWASWRMRVKDRPEKPQNSGWWLEITAKPSLGCQLTFWLARRCIELENHSIWSFSLLEFKVHLAHARNFFVNQPENPCIHLSQIRFRWPDCGCPRSAK